MSTIDDRPIYDGRAPGDALRVGFRSDYIAESFDGADEALAALEAVQGDLTTTAFQTLDWLIVLFEELAPTMRATPRVVVVTDGRSGETALALPLVVSGKRLRVARFADLGVAGYGGPILGPAAPVDARASRSVQRAVRAALRDVDLISLERMPVRLGQRDNPLLLWRGAAPSRRSCASLTMADTFEAFLFSRGEAFCAEVARGMSALRKSGVAKFYRATSESDIARAFSELEDQEAAQSAVVRSTDARRDAALRAFYERIVMDASDTGLSHVFTLEVGGRIVATLFGVVHDGGFTMLRMTERVGTQNEVSAGLLIIVEVLHHLSERDIRRFEFGVGCDRFRFEFGADAMGLTDVISASNLLGAPMAMAERARNRIART
ncbi:MAG: GNAT family N-acetyltransferase [Hyphomicrobium sp.]